MNKSLTRSIGFWLLLVLSLAAVGVGGWIVADQLGTMTSTLLDGTATGIEVYVGQSLVVVGAALLGAGVIGILIAVALVAVQALLPTPTPVVVEPIDWTAEPGTETGAETLASTNDASADPVETTPQNDAAESADRNDADQNGSSGSTATATKISVK